MLYIVLAYLMLFAALTNSVCLNNASFFFLFKYFLCQGYELSGEIALKNNHYYYLQTHLNILERFQLSFLLISVPPHLVHCLLYFIVHILPKIFSKSLSSLMILFCYFLLLLIHNIPSLPHPPPSSPLLSIFNVLS